MLRRRFSVDPVDNSGHRFTLHPEEAMLTSSLARPAFWFMASAYGNEMLAQIVRQFIENSLTGVIRRCTASIVDVMNNQRRPGRCRPS